MASPSTAIANNKAPKRGRRSLFLLALLCAAPVIASYFLYFAWKPAGTRNYGELIAPAVVPEIAAADPSRPDIAGLKGKWVLLSVDGAECGDACRTKLWQMRQVRLTQGKEMDRIARAWLVDDGGVPGQPLLGEYQGTVLLSPSIAPRLSEMLKDRSPRDHLFLIDPLGNLMMRFPKDPDMTKVRKDLGHLLQVSRIG